MSSGQAGEGPLSSPPAGNVSFESEPNRPARSRFRFKSKTSRHRHEQDELDSGAGRPRRRSRHHDAEPSHHRAKRRKYERAPGLVDDPSFYDDTYLPNTASKEYLPPDVAFRESLFDALADDEGAAFWEGVYGQPIHTYSAYRQSPEGELEKMTDEEYTSYVRAKMYEKTHQHVLEERRRREEAGRRRKQSREETARLEREKAGFQDALEQSLKRGKERKERKAWSDAWRRYQSGWKEIEDGRPPDKLEDIEDEGDKAIRRRIPWPVLSGKCADIRKDDVERFYRQGPVGSGEVKESKDGLGQADLLAILKRERVRWHPDKVQQRFGRNRIGENTLQKVTAVFQVIDGLWSSARESGSGKHA